MHPCQNIGYIYIIKEIIINSIAMKLFFILFWIAPFFISAESLHILNYTQKVKVGFRPEINRKIDVIVIHSSYNAASDTFNVEGILREYAHYKVAAHYLIDRHGIIYQLVPEGYEAFHAGKSRLPMTNRTNINATSIGIELINTPSDPPDEQQYQALVALILDIKKRYPITFIVGHHDIAPKRKTDPWLFDWGKFWSLMRAQDIQTQNN